MAHCSEIIDLTDSFCLATHRSLADIIIELDTDDSMTRSFLDSNQENGQDNAAGPSKNTGRREEKRSKIIGTSKNRRLKPKQLDKQTKEVNRSKSMLQSAWGDCPICWDTLGRNPLASTKCGHVYCMKCLERSLKVERKCPTCRHVLKGSSAYHPLYLN